MLDFANQHDVYRWLNGTICKYKGELVYVTVEDGNRNVNEIFVTPFGGKKIKVKCTDDDFSVIMPELGYVNADTGAYYMMKRPNRVQRAAISTDTIGFKHRIPVNGGQVLNGPEGYNMLMDIYPSFKECEKKVNWEDQTSMAFAKHLAIVMPNKYSKYIEYRGDIVVLWNHNLEKWIIPEGRKDTSYLRIILKRNGVEV